MIREGSGESSWSRLHARQAFVFGLAASAGLIAVLALPLAIVIGVSGISTGTTISVYTAGLIADVIAGLTYVFFALRYSTRAARGELFSIPLVTPLVDRFFRLQRP